jgi:hypothetical protein
VDESVVMTPEQIRECAAAGVLAGVLVLSGCGSADVAPTSSTPTRSAAQASTPAPAAPAATAPSGDLRGSWTRTMTARDWQGAGSGFPLGTWRMVVDRAGAVSVYLPGTDTVDFTTQFAVKGQRLTIDSVPVCPGTKGRYTWRASAKALTMTVVDDQACTARAALFGGTWTRRS